MLKGLVKSSRTYKFSCKFSLIAKSAIWPIALENAVTLHTLATDNNEILVMKVIRK